MMAWKIRSAILCSAVLLVVAVALQLGERWGVPIAISRSATSIATAVWLAVMIAILNQSKRLKK